MKTKSERLQDEYCDMDRNTDISIRRAKVQEINAHEYKVKELKSPLRTLQRSKGKIQRSIEEDLEGLFEDLYVRKDLEKKISILQYQLEELEEVDHE